VVTGRLIRLILKMNDSKPSNPSGGGYATNSAVDVCQIVKTMFITEFSGYISTTSFCSCIYSQVTVDVVYR
jgi:hypothetical protein